MVKNTVDLYIKNWIYSSGSTHYLGFITGKDNFRFESATTWIYKGNRIGTEKPSWYPDIRDYVVEHWKSMVIDKMEADDGLSLAQVYFQGLGIEAVIVTEDKDLLQVPGLHYNTNKSDKVFNMTELDGHFKLWCQVITGDKTDNIPGVSHAITETTLGSYNAMVKATVEDSTERRKQYRTYPRQELFGDATAAKYLLEFTPDQWPSKALELYIDKYEDGPEDEGYGDLRFYETFALVFMLRRHPDHTEFPYYEVPVDKRLSDMFEVYQ